MKVFKFVYKNALRHKLRTSLTALGIAIAILAFCLLRTVIDAYFTGVEASSNTRLVVSNKVSLTFALPYSYKEKIKSVPGVTEACVSQWFGGIYIDEKNFFAQLAVEPEPFLKLFPEFVLTEEEEQNFLKERNSCIVGRKLAEKYGWKPGDTFRITGTIFPGDWDFVIRGIYEGKNETTDESSMFFHWKYIEERMRQEAPGREGYVGTFWVGIEDESMVTQVSEAIDTQFVNSSFETKTETEKEFQLSFISMVGTIITSIKVISVVVIAIILLVLANTMTMTVRERVAEYAIMKTVGFRPKHLIGIIWGESLTIAIFGGLLGLLLSVPTITGFEQYLTQTMGSFFPIFKLSQTTLLLAIVATLLVGIAASIFPTTQAVKMKIADGLRRIE